MVKENITWEEERIADELSLKLGIYVSPRTVREYWPKDSRDRGGRRTSSQHCKTFVKNHAARIVACDILVEITVRFRVLFVFVAMEVGSCRILHYNLGLSRLRIGRCNSYAKRFLVAMVISS
jgi:hypothetical protein